MPSLKSGSLAIALISLLWGSSAVCLPTAAEAPVAAVSDFRFADHQLRSLERPPNELGRVLSLAFGFYRSCISSQDGSKCGYTPSCSRFGQESMRRFGFQGLFMTSDRLQRCHGCSGGFYVHHPGTGLGLDPVSDNVLWGRPQGTSDHRHGDASSSARSSAPLPDHEPSPTTAADGADDDTHLSYDSYYGPDALGRFAADLAARGDFHRAAGEYERLLSILPADDSRRRSVRYLIGKNLLCAGDADLATSYLEGLSVAPLSRELEPLVRRELALCDLARGRYAQARERLAGNRASLTPSDSTLPEPPSAPADAREIVGASFLLESRWQEALAALSLPDGNAGPDLSSLSLTLQDLATAGLHARDKSGTLAGIYSALIPGAGKIYTGRTADGIFSFLTIAFCTWQAVDGFGNDGTESTKGWIFGGLASGFYAGNIYGSVLSARISTREGKLDLMTRTEAVIAGLSCDF